MKVPPLWKHQAAEVEAHGRDRARGLLWSMRTGKTRPIIESARRLRESGEVTGLLVIAPNGVHAQWIDREIPRWMPEGVHASLAWRSGSTKPEDARDVLADSRELGLRCLALNVDALRVERAQFLVRSFLKSNGGGERVMVAFDESHEFRRPGARKTRLARGLAGRCRYRRILTGTAALNSPLHLWSQFELLWPCALGHRTFGEFQSYHAEFRQQRRRDGRSYPQITGYRRLEELREWVSLWASVVPRSEADVPDVLRTTRIVALSAKQRRAYDDLKRDTLKVAAEGGGEVEVKAHMMKLQQVLGGFVHTDSTLREAKVHSVDDDPPRLSALVEEVVGSEPCKVIVWCRFREDIRRCVAALRKAGVETVEYHGGVNAADRESAIVRFQGGSEPVAFVGQPQAAGQGLDLSAASTIIWYSHVHDAIVREQASARASARGDTAVVLVDLVAEGTLDQGMLDLLDGKASLAEALTGEGLAALLSGASPTFSNFKGKGLLSDELSEYDVPITSRGRRESSPHQGERDMAQRKKVTRKAASKKTASKKATSKKRTGPTIGETACKAIKGGATNEEALTAVKAAHPEGRTTMSSIAWYRNDMRKRGEKVKTSREISSARRAKKAKAAKGS